MIKFEHTVLASPEQMKFIIEGMRNLTNSWEKSDSGNGCHNGLCSGACSFSPQWCGNNPGYVLGENDISLMKCLSNAGIDYRKFMRMMPVYVRITAPLYWWEEFDDTYKVGTVANSCSTTCKIQAKEFDDIDFSCEHMTPQSTALFHNIISELNDLREYYLEWDRLDDYFIKAQRWHDKKDIWWQMFQLLPNNYNQTRNVMMNYEVLTNIYKSCKNRELDEWRNFYKWIEELPYSELITGGANAKIS